MANERPTVIVLAGPNGSGKSTAAPKLLRDVLGVVEFVNADTIAQGLAAFSTEMVALEAGSIMLSRLQHLADRRRTFAFETTLAGRSLASRLSRMIKDGYDFHLVFLWLPSAELAVARVADRVRAGGHNVPEATIRRRYEAGLKNLFQLYMPLAARWRIYNNSNVEDVRLIAEGAEAKALDVPNNSLWELLKKEYSYAE